MSIYLYSTKINELLNTKVIDIELPKIVATAHKGEEKIKLTYQDYNEKKLQQFVEKKSHNNIIVNPYFWNYKYCHLDMLNRKNKFESLALPNTMLVDLELFFLGNFVMLLSYFNILEITFSPTNNGEYEKYLDRINIDRIVFAEFIIKNNFKFPLTDNFMKLIKRIFTNENILDLVFLNNLFTIDEITDILSHFDYGSLNMTSEYIFNSYLPDSEKLLLCEKLIDQYPYMIDTDKIIYLDMKKFKPYLCYYLYTMEIPDEYVNIYYCVWKLYLDNNGAPELIILNDEELNEKIKRRYLALKDNFNLK